MFDLSRGAGLALSAVALVSGMGVSTAWATQTTHAKPAAAAPVATVARPAAVLKPSAADAGPPCGWQNTVESCVAAFYGTYIHTVAAPGDNGAAVRRVRTRYLDPALDRALDAWARKHKADPVLSAQDVPGGYDTTVLGKGRIRVLLHWGAGADAYDSHVDVTVDLESQRISGITHPA